MERFSIFIGTWNTTGEVYATDVSSATTLSATDTYRWLPGRYFIIHEVDARFGDDVSRSLEVFGYDAETKKYLAHSYDDRGAREAFEVILNGRRWKIIGKSVRFDGRFSPVGDRLEGLWEMKGKRGWLPWIKLSLSRA
jgi:hypothetical protein